MQVKRYYERKNFSDCSLHHIYESENNFRKHFGQEDATKKVPTFFTCSQLWLNCGGTREVRSDVSM